MYQLFRIDQAIGGASARGARMFSLAADDALRGLRVTLAGHTTRDGVLFAARTWIITAGTAP